MLCKYILHPWILRVGSKAGFHGPQKIESPLKSEKIDGLQVAFDFHCHHWVYQQEVQAGARLNQNAFIWIKKHRPFSTLQTSNRAMEYVEYVGDCLVIWVCFV